MRPDRPRPPRPDPQLDALDRARIAGQIHDDLLPLLFAARQAVSRVAAGLPDAEGIERQRLTQAEQWLDQAMHRCRLLLEEADPAELPAPSWPAAVQQAIPHMLSDSSPPARPMDIRWELDDDARGLPAPVATAIYRIVTEALRNAVRHGGATTASVRARRVGADVVVDIRDDGSGFNPAELPADRYGIRAMRRRAELLGGTLQLDSTLGGPTTVTAQIPV